MGAELLATLLTFLVVNPYRTRKHQDEAGHNNPESLRAAERICWLNENELQENVRSQKEKEEAPEKQQVAKNSAFMANMAAPTNAVLQRSERSARFLSLSRFNASFT